MILNKQIKVFRTLVPMLLASLIATSTDVLAGTMVTMDVNDDGNIVEQVLFVESGKMAMSPSNANGQFIYDATTDIVTIINHDEQSFYSLTEGDVESALGMANMFTGGGLTSIIASQIENLPIDQQAEARRLLESMGGGNAQQAAPTTVDKSGTRININGMNCEVMIIRKAKQQLGHACIGNASALGIPEDDWQTFNRFLDLSWKYFGQAAEVARKFGQNIPDLGTQKIEGVPIQFIDVNSPTKPMLTLKGIQSSRMPAELLAIPQNYRQARLPFLQ